MSLSGFRDDIGKLHENTKEVGIGVSILENVLQKFAAFFATWPLNNITNASGPPSPHIPFAVSLFLRSLMLSLHTMLGFY